MHAIDVIRTAEDSIIRRYVAYRRIISRLLARTWSTSRKKRKEKSTRFLRCAAAQKRDNRRIERFIGIFMLQTITIALLILYFITRLFFSHYQVLSETTTSVIVIYREETNGRKTERKREHVYVYVYVSTAEYRRTRVKMYDFNVQGVQEKGIEIRILFLYVKKRKN